MNDLSVGEDNGQTYIVSIEQLMKDSWMHDENRT